MEMNEQHTFWELMRMWREDRETRSQNLLGAVKALTEAGYAVTNAEALVTGDLVIRAYLGKSGESEPVSK